MRESVLFFGGPVDGKTRSINIEKCREIPFVVECGGFGLLYKDYKINKYFVRVGRQWPLVRDETFFGYVAVWEEADENKVQAAANGHILKTKVKPAIRERERKLIESDMDYQFIEGMADAERELKRKVRQKETC